MLDRFGRVIYVGKAKNLRARLRSYRTRQFNSLPAKTQRLLAHVQEICWQETETETGAFLLESECIRALRPRFNVVGTTSGSYSYFSVHESSSGLTLELSVGRLPANAADRTIGAFRGIASARFTHSALARWIWVNARGRCDWPARFFRRTLPTRVFIPWPDDEPGRCGIDRDLVKAAVEFFLLGLSPLPELVLPEDDPQPILQMVWRDDQIHLSRFFHTCESLKLLREKFELGDRPLTISEVDDLRILAREGSKQHRESLRDN